ncbi:MAG: guanine deaminase [Pikeienuella sp.]
MQTLLTGQTIEFIADPFTDPNAIRHRESGGVVIENGTIIAVGEAADMISAAPGATRIDYGKRLIAPGFVDAHNHYPQTGIIASWGKRLIDWLNTYTFPEEMRFGDADYAAAIAETYLDLLIANGVTSAAAFCTIHPESVDALFTASLARGMRMTCGKVMMDRNAPDGLRDDAQTGYDDSAALIAKWQGRGRLTYAITPRFAPTSSEAQLAAAGALWAEHPSCAMQTHLSEQVEEIAWMQELFPRDADYLSVYERHGLCRVGAIMGHAIHLTDRERAALAETGAAVSHCPTSNAFIGSGLCDVKGLRQQGLTVGLATDIGGGSSFSMLATMKSAYEIGQLRGDALSPSQLWWLATVGSANALRVDDKVGALAAGMEADICVFDPAATPVLAQRTARAESIEDLLFALLILGDDRAIAATWVNGQLLKDIT